jgi:hypothetical protein
MDLEGHVDRRRFLQIAAGGVTVTALASPALAASGKYEAMVLSCIDPRFQAPVSKYTAGRKLTGKYSQFTIAGASIAVVAPAFKDWHKTFWDNLAASMELHGIETVTSSTIGTVARPRSPTGRRPSPTLRPRRRPTGTRSPSFASRWPSATRSCASRRD